MKDFLTRIYEDFKVEEENWCEIADSQFVPNGLSNKIYGGYEKEHFQQFYMLKYTPLYIAEYVEIYEKFLEDYDKDTLRVLSVGVGSGLDYYALTKVLEERNNIELEYLGIDLVDWNYRNEKIDFEQVDLKDISENEHVIDFIQDGIDVVIFPKSIIEIPTYIRQRLGIPYQNDAFTELCNILVENHIDDVWFLNSYIKTYKEVTGLNEFSHIVDNLKSEGYIIVNGVDEKHYYESSSGENSVHYPLDYRNTWQLDLQNYCHRKCSEEQAEKCRLAQYPMLRKSHIAFGITNFKKVA